MVAVIQRVGFAKVEVEGIYVAQIGAGLLVLLGISIEDEIAQADVQTAELASHRRLN